MTSSRARCAQSHCLAEPPNPPKPIIAAISGSSSSSSSSDTCAGFCSTERPQSQSICEQTCTSPQHYAGVCSCMHCALKCCLEQPTCELVAIGCRSLSNPSIPFACPWPAAASPPPPPLAAATPPGRSLHMRLNGKPILVHDDTISEYVNCMQKQLGTASNQPLPSATVRSGSCSTFFSFRACNLLRTCAAGNAR
jgi:hypothetical protein